MESGIGGIKILLF